MNLNDSLTAESKRPLLSLGLTPRPSRRGIIAKRNERTESERWRSANIFAMQNQGDVSFDAARRKKSAKREE